MVDSPALDEFTRGLGQAAPRAVGELAGGFRVSRPAISKHLAVLRRAGLVREERDGRQRLYRLDPAPLRELASWADGYRGFWASNLASPKRHVERKELT